MARRIGRSSDRGFTLVEVIVATSIGAFVTLVAVASLRSTSAASAMVQLGSDKAIELRFAARWMAMDLANILRETDPNLFRLEVGVEDSGYGSQSYITCWIVSHQKVRPGQPEADVFEVSYQLVSRQDKTVFCRRIWPHPTRDVVEPGGVVTVLTDQVAAMKILCFDGEQWQEEWPDTAQQLPDMIEVTLLGKPDGGGLVMSESFLVVVRTSVEAQALTQAQTMEGLSQGGQAVQESSGSGQSSATEQSAGGGR